MGSAGALTFSVLSIFVACLWATIAVWEHRRGARRILLGASPSLDDQHFPSAGIAGDIGPILNLFVKSGSTIRVLGGDGFPVAQDSYGWRKYLEEWLKKSCQITYMVIDPSPSVAEMLLNMQKQYAGFQCCFVHSVAAASNENDKRLLERMKTFHPTLAENDDGERAMWIEKYHPPGSTVAFGCTFVGPESARSDPRYDDYLAKFQYVKEKYCESRTAA